MNSPRRRLRLGFWVYLPCLVLGVSLAWSQGSRLTLYDVECSRYAVGGRGPSAAT